MAGHDDILMDDWAAKAKNRQGGEELSGLTSIIVVATSRGIVEAGKGARLFVPIGNSGLIRVPR